VLIALGGCRIKEKFEKGRSPDLKIKSLSIGGDLDKNSAHLIFLKRGKFDVRTEKKGVEDRYVGE